MKRILSAFVVLTLCAVGCGDDDDNIDGAGGDNTGGTEVGQAGQPEGNGGTSAAGAATGTAGQPGNNVGCDPEAATTCQNEQDCPFVEDGTARSTAQACGRACLGEPSSCTVDCMQGQIDVSSDCAGCYADIVTCTAGSKCLSPCVEDPESQECADCQVEVGCREAFNECSGLSE